MIADAVRAAAAADVAVVVVALTEEHSVQAEVQTNRRLWRRWDTARGGWDTAGPGRQLRIARGLGDIRATIDLPSQ